MRSGWVGEDELDTVQFHSFSLCFSAQSLFLVNWFRIIESFYIMRELVTNFERSKTLSLGKLLSPGEHFTAAITKFPWQCTS